MTGRQAATVLGTTLGVALYVTGLQKKVVSPVLSWAGDRSTAVQLALIVAVGVIGVSALFLRRRLARVELARAIELVGRPAPGTGTPVR